MKFICRLLILLIIISAGFHTCLAFELDMSVDQDIRQNYDPSKLENDVLPDLPQNLKQSQDTQSKSTKTSSPAKTNASAVPKTTLDTNYSNDTVNINKSDIHSIGNNSYTEIKVKKGTKFQVKSMTKVSDWNTAGARMTFVTTAPVTKRYVSFPTETTFKGVIEESHQPAYAGNGGLLKLKADKVAINGNMHSVNAFVTKANGKFIYFNNIKGKRGYWKGVVKNVDRGQQFYTKSRAMSSRWAQNPVGVIVSPVPTVVGVVGYGANLVASPVVAIWSKGEHITLPAGTAYTLKLKEDLYLYK